MEIILKKLLSFKFFAGKSQFSCLEEKLEPDPSKPHSFDYDERQDGVVVAYGRERGDNDDGDSQVIIWLGAGYFVIPNQLDLKAQLFVRSGDHGNMGGDASGLYVGAEFFF